MHLRGHIFFTLNDFRKDGGGTIRMKGIVNALVESGQNVTLLSNAESYDGFHSLVKHIFLDIEISKREKRVFQFLLSLLPIVITKQIFKNYSKTIAKLFKKENLTDEMIISFEYLDNSMAYFLKEQKIIDGYVNDTHGIAPLEFLYKKTDSFTGKIINRLKYVMALKLDKKVLQNAKGTIFVSDAMQEYFESKHPFINAKENYIVRDGVNSSLCQQTIDSLMVESYKEKYNIQENDKVVFFAGNFKDLGGIMDLIEAFSILVSRNKFKNLKLLLLGDGERHTDARNIVKKYRLEDKVIFVGWTKYAELKNHQELAHVIVCPDKQHPFSELVPHIKYFDSLASGKMVINGSFASVKEMNPNEKFSVDFEPSNVIDLADKIEMVLQDLEYFSVKYKDNKKIICSEFTYGHFTKVLMR